MVTSQDSFKVIPILLLAFLTACAMVEPRGGGGGGKVGNRIYVANQGANTVSFIDATSHAVIKTVQLDVKGPHDLALTRDGRTLYVTTLLSGYVVVIDTATFDIVTTIPTGNRAHSMALTNDERQLWVVNIGENNVSIIDLEKLRIVGTVPVGRLPGHIRFSKDGRFAYVTSQQDEQVIVLDTSTLAVVKTVAVGKMPHFLIPSTDDKLLWGGNSGGNDVYVIDMSTNERIGSIEVGAKPQHIAFGVRGMFGPFAYVAVQGTDEVVVIDANPGSLKIVDRIKVGPKPNGVAASPEGGRVYVSTGSDELYVIDTATHRVIAKIPIGINPVGVAASFH